MTTLEMAQAKVFDLVKDIMPFDGIEQKHKSDALDWIKSGINIFRVGKPDKPPKHLVSYFVLVDPEQQSLLLGDHIKAQQWLPSGGHVELGEDPKDTVRREIKEELGIDAIFLRNYEQPLFVTVRQTVGLTAGHTDVSLWYIVRGTLHRRLRFDRREFQSMEWFTFQEILESDPSIFDPNLQRFTKKLICHLELKDFSVSTP